MALAFSVWMCINGFIWQSKALWVVGRPTVHLHKIRHFDIMLNEKNECIWSINNPSRFLFFPLLFSVISPSLLPCSLNLLWLSGDPGHNRTAQTKQWNVQQSFQQLLFPGRWPRAWITGQSHFPCISQFIDQSISGVILCNESWEATSSS